MKYLYLIKSKRVAAILIILVLASGVSIFALNNKQDVDNADNTLNRSDLNISGSMQLAPGGDVQQDKVMQGGDTVRFTFKVDNKYDREAKQLNLNTDINKSLIFYIRNIQGTTGLDSQTDKLIFRNITVQPNQSINISFDSTLVYSTEKGSIRLQPKLFDAKDKFIIQGTPRTYDVEKNNDSEIPGNVKVEGN